VLKVLVVLVRAAKARVAVRSAKRNHTARVSGSWAVGYHLLSTRFSVVNTLFSLLVNPMLSIQQYTHATATTEATLHDT